MSRQQLLWMIASVYERISFSVSQNENFRDVPSDPFEDCTYITFREEMRYD